MMDPRIHYRSLSSATLLLHGLLERWNDGSAGDGDALLCRVTLRSLLQRYRAGTDAPLGALEVATEYAHSKVAPQLSRAALCQTLDDQLSGDLVTPPRSVRQFTEAFVASLDDARRRISSSNEEPAMEILELE